MSGYGLVRHAEENPERPQQHPGPGNDALADAKEAVEVAVFLPFRPLTPSDLETHPRNDREQHPDGAGEKKRDRRQDNHGTPSIVQNLGRPPGASPGDDQSRRHHADADERVDVDQDDPHQALPDRSTPVGPLDQALRTVQIALDPVIGGHSVSYRCHCSSSRCHAPYAQETPRRVRCYAG